ncbi:MAG: hypothetical protein SH847_26490 [Roseiflexaceae bacterium]|nr:hypothetical protein [Roseiflexaceae bacterium]
MTSLQGDPNSSVSFDYIPGRTLRGALLARFLHDHHLRDAQTLEHVECRRIFFSGQVRFLNAYLLNADGIRSLPTPQSLRMAKHADLERTPDVYNTSHRQWTPTKQQEIETQCNDQLIPIGAPFAILGDQLSLLSPKRNVAVHMQRNPRYGRALAGEGTVFQYDALAEGQVFGAVIIVELEKDIPTIIQLLDEIDICWLGRSRSANYGKIRLDDPQHEPAWRENGRDQAADLEPGVQHSLTLLSDTILRDDQGAFLSIPDATNLSRYLGFTVQIIDTHTHTTLTNSGGFNRAWKLPLVQEYALAAGCVISFTVDQVIDATTIANLELRGIGERRIEGFGQITFDWLTALRYAAVTNTRNEPRSRTTVALPPVAQNLARRMAQQLLDVDLDRAIAAFVDSKRSTAQSMPENSQLGRLRVIVRQALPLGDIALVRKQFETFKAAGMLQFERARFDGVVFRTWIENLLDQHPNVLQRFAEFDSPTVAAAHAEPDTGRVALRLLAALLNALAREKELAQ